MYDKGHFCLAIFPKVKCDENSKKHVYEDVVARFLTQLFPRNEKEAHHLMWNPVEKSPLFEPKANQDCTICSSLFKIFEKKRGKTEPIVLFSHNILDIINFKAFLTPIMNHDQIEKIYYLELDREAERNFQDIVKHNLKKLKTTEIFDLKEKNEFKMGVLYEIVN